MTFGLYAGARVQAMVSGPKPLRESHASIPDCRAVRNRAGAGRFLGRDGAEEARIARADPAAAVDR